MCIDIVGASKDIVAQNNNIKLLLNYIYDFFDTNNLNSKKATSFTGDGVFIVFGDDNDDNNNNNYCMSKSKNEYKDESNKDNKDKTKITVVDNNTTLLLPLELSIALHREFRKNQYKQLAFKIGIAYGEANIVEEAEIINGLPYWGDGPTTAKRLCDLCDAFHILINDRAEKKFKENISSDNNVDILFGKEYEEVFQDIGKYYVKHKQQLEVFNFCITLDNNQVIGNLSLPLDKRGIIDRLPIDENLARPLDFFFEREAYDLVRKINKDSGMVLFIDSAKRLYESLFENTVDYYGINKILPSEFYEYNHQFLIKHAELLRRYKKRGIRIMLMTKDQIRKDWYCNSTRESNTNFIRFHIDNNIKLIQINPEIVAQKIIPNLVSKYNSFYLQSSHIGIWKERYVVLFGKLELKNNVKENANKIHNRTRTNYSDKYDDDSEQNLRIGKFWIFSDDMPQYKYCEAMHELLTTGKPWLNELIFDNVEKPFFKKCEEIVIS